MRLHEEFKLYETMWDNLNEAKVDIERLVTFAGQELADRFQAIKNRLKSPENDLYYWIKNKTPEELEQAISAAESAKSNTQMKKEIADHGAELVADTAHWKVYHITTFAASKKYGRDSQWCITGIDNYGDHYWKQYTSQGIQFYFAIAKENYNPRGRDSKFAFAVYPPERAGYVNIYNQQDDPASLSDIPYYQEIKIPGVDLSKVVDPRNFNEFDEEVEHYCTQCGCELRADTAFIGADDEQYCEDCWVGLFFDCDNCGETTPLVDSNNTVFGNCLCEECWSAFVESEGNNAQAFANWAQDGIETFVSVKTEEEKQRVEKDLHKFATSWFVAKNAKVLNYTEDEMARIEQALFDNAAALGLDFKKEQYIQKHDYSYLDNPMDTGYNILVDGSNKRAENHSINVEQALAEILAFINNLSDDEKPRVSSSWRCASTGYDPDYEHFMDGYEGELIVNIYSDAEQEMGLWNSEEERLQEKTAANYAEAEDKIRAALGLQGASTKPLTEASYARQSYEALMDIQARFNDLPGWMYPDPVQDDEYSMTIKYTLAPDTYVWQELDDGEYEYVPEVEEIADRCRKLGVSLSIVENYNAHRHYDIVVYLHYEG